MEETKSVDGLGEQANEKACTDETARQPAGLSSTETLGPLKLGEDEMKDQSSRYCGNRRRLSIARASTIAPLTVAALFAVVLAVQPRAAAQSESEDASIDDQDLFSDVGSEDFDPGTVLRFGAPATPAGNEPNVVVSVHQCGALGTSFTLDLHPDVTHIQLGDDPTDAAGAGADAVRVRIGTGEWQVMSISGCQHLQIFGGSGSERVQIGEIDGTSALQQLRFYGGGFTSNQINYDPGVETVTVDAALPGLVAASFYLLQGDDVFTASNAVTPRLLVAGGTGDDVLTGGGGSDVLFGDDGNDVLMGRAGNDYLRGGLGDDTLRGGDGDDLLSGERGDDLLAGGSGDDSLIGAEGADVIFGNDGKDRVNGGTGWDTIWGGAGNDNLKGESGNDQVSGGLGHDYLSGGGGDDVAFGGDGSDVIKGGTGEDTLYGGRGNDVMHGNSRDDILRGGDGDDELYGGTGYDHLYGYGGQDTCTGGTGGDSFIDCETQLP